MNKSFQLLVVQFLGENKGPNIMLQIKVATSFQQKTSAPPDHYIWINAWFKQTSRTDHSVFSTIYTKIHGQQASTLWKFEQLVERTELGDHPGDSWALDISISFSGNILFSLQYLHPSIFSSTTAFCEHLFIAAVFCVFAPAQFTTQAVSRIFCKASPFQPNT